MTMQGKYLRLVDKVIGRFFYLAAYPLVKMLPKSRSGGVLAIKLWALGDSIATLPALKALKEKNSQKKLTILCTKNNALVYELSGIPDEVLVLEYGNPLSLVRVLARLLKGFSLCVDFEPYSYFSSFLCGMTRSPDRTGFSNRGLLYTKRVAPEKIHIAANYMRLVGGGHYALVPLHVGKESEREASSLLPSGKVIAVHPGSSSSSPRRKWSAENFANLCDALASRHGATIIVIGTKADNGDANAVAEKMHHPAVNLCGRTSLPVLASLLRKVSLLIANDSGPMHMAAAMKTPVLGLFGPNNPEFFGPLGGVSLYHGPDEPWIKPFEGKFPGSCPEEYDVNRITVAEALEAANGILARGNTRPL